MIVTVLDGELLRFFFLEVQQNDAGMLAPVYNNNEGQQAPYNDSFPPHYASTSEDTLGKPPSYEQSLENLAEINADDNNANSIEDPDAMFSNTRTTVSSENLIVSTKN